MSTNGLIARATGESKFRGVYHHWDSGPESLGAYLVELYLGHFQHDLDRMLTVLIDNEGKAGWSTIVHKDFRLKPGWTLERLKTPGFDCSEAERKVRWAAYQAHPDYRRPQSYLARGEEPQTITEVDDAGPWAYVFDDERILHVLLREKHQQSGEYFWNDVGRVELNSPEPINWVAIECGESFERCHHYAWYHKLLPRTSNLSTRTWLGLDPLDFRDAIGFIIQGKRYEATGSGGNSDYLRRVSGKNLLPGTWISTVKASNGRRLDIPVAAIKSTDKGQKYLPLPGVVWIYPGTKDNPHETLVSLKPCVTYDRRRV